MIQTSLSFLANHPLPIEIGTISVSPDGTPRHHAPAALEFGFDFAGAEFTARIEPVETGARLQLDAAMAPMPYSGEHRQRRRDALMIIRASRTGLRHGRFLLDAQGQIRLLGELSIGRPVTPAALVAATTRMLIGATPWIALLFRYLGPAAPHHALMMPTVTDSAG